MGGGGGGGCEALLGVVVAVVVGGGTGVVVVVVGVGGGAENGGSIANRMSANTNAATIAAIHHLRRGCVRLQSRTRGRVGQHGGRRCFHDPGADGKRCGAGAGQRGSHRAGLVEPRCRVARHRTFDRGGKARWHIRAQRGEGRRRLVQDRVCQRAQVLLRERPPPGQCLVTHHADGIQVVDHRGRLGRQPLGTQIGHAADDFARPGVGGAGRLGDAEVGELGFARSGEQDVAGLDVAVEDAGVMRLGKGV